MHALQRMLERDISKEEVMYCIENGTIIEEYPNDTPYPSYLKHTIYKTQPLHVVYAKAKDNIIVITVYRPDPSKWNENFTKRKK